MKHAELFERIVVALIGDCECHVDGSHRLTDIAEHLRLPRCDGVIALEELRKVVEELEA